MVEERFCRGGEEGRGEEEANTTALLGDSGVGRALLADGILRGERRQDFVGELGTAGWYDGRVTVSVHLKVLLIMFLFSFSALDVADELPSPR